MALTLIQRKLLKLLALNCRYSNKDLAQTLGVSADTVQYQIDKLVAEEYVWFELHVDCRYFGYEYYQFFVTLSDPTVDVKPIVALPCVTFVGKTVGQYDYNGTFVAKDAKAKDDALAAIQSVLGSALRTLHVARLGHEYKWTYIIEPFALSVQRPVNKKNPLYARSQENLATVPKEVPMDATDFHILGALAENPRAPYVHIGEQLSLSHETVRNRIKHMIDRGLALNFTIFCNFQKFGYFLHCIPLRVGDFDKKAFSRFTEEKVYFQYATEFEGDFNMMIYVSAKDPEEFAAYAAEIRHFFGEQLYSMQLLYFEKQLKNLQFPTVLLQNNNSIVTTNI
jgi:DNA-binding Lrp family transcriptional regulator